MIHWWSLPGPRAFVEQVVGEVRQGKSVFLYLPEHHPKRLASIFREALQEDYRWLSLSSYDGGDPVEYLFESCASSAHRESLRSVQDLVQQEAFQGQLIWLEGVGGALAEFWAPFFLEYERASRAVPPARQTVFIIFLEGLDCRSAFPAAVGLSHHRWDDCLRRTDMSFYSALLIQDRDSSLETDLVTALVATLSGWDPVLCESFALLDLAELINPREKLSTFAQQRGWVPEQNALFDLSAWQLGFWQTVDGRPVVHTSLCSRDADIDRLIWRAEVGVLLPYIEEQRQILLDRYARYLTAPFVTNQGILIEDIRDLEIGMIQFQLKDCTDIPAESKALITNLKKARNSLSHLEPIRPAVLLSICEQAASESASFKRQRT
jgi:hypothetical protein